MTGHYTAYICSTDHKWYYIDDSHVFQVRLLEVLFKIPCIEKHLFTLTEYFIMLVQGSYSVSQSSDSRTVHEIIQNPGHEL